MRSIFLAMAVAIAILPSMAECQMALRPNTKYKLMPVTVTFLVDLIAFFKKINLVNS